MTWQMAVPPSLYAAFNLRATSPQTTIEVLIPDLCGNWDALEVILTAQPEVLNHNTETVPRLYRRCVLKETMSGQWNCYSDRVTLPPGSTLNLA